MYRFCEILGAALVGFILLDLWIGLLGWAETQTEGWWRFLGISGVNLEAETLRVLLFAKDTVLTACVGGAVAGLMTFCAEAKWWQILVATWAAVAIRMLVDMIVESPDMVAPIGFMLSNIDFWVLVGASIVTGWVVDRRKRRKVAQQRAPGDAAKLRA